MTKAIAWCAFISANIAWLVLSLSVPWVLGDNNAFLAGFVNHELIAFLGVMVTVTLASAANLHLSLNRLEESANRAGVKHSGFVATRQSVRSSAFWLIGLLLIALMLVVAKPLATAGATTQRASSFLNGAALMVVLCNILILIDLTQTAFAIGPEKK